MAKSKSSKQRVAEFLVGKVGVGNRFTMQQLREAVPSVEQGRRLRDLRAAGWVIHSVKDDSTLGPSEYRFVQGAATIDGQSRISNRVRREVFDRAGNRCQVRGVGAGEPYPDEPELGERLQIGHHKPLETGGTNDPENLRAECARCNESIRSKTGTPDSLEDVWVEIRDLRASEKDRLRRWIENGYRPTDGAERMWVEYRQLPPAAQEDIGKRLEGTTA